MNAALPDGAIEVLASLAEHRALSTAQVAEVHLPGRSLRRAQQVLVSLERAGLVGHADLARSPRRLWFASEAGAAASAQAGLLSGAAKVTSAEVAAGALRDHTFAVNEAAICFLRTARERGDDFGPLSWRHEVANPLGSGRGRRRGMLIADALLTYLRGEEDEVVVEQRFLELDRATLSVERLAAELGRYAALHRTRGSDGEALWRSRYPSFPGVICILAGASRTALVRRRDVALALLRRDPELAGSERPAILVGLLEDLREEGPFGTVFKGPWRPGEPVDWLGAAA
jgi:hypothetical protein